MMMARCCSIVLLVLAAWVATGCDRTNPPANCSDHISIRVSADSIPVFTWSPPCAAAGVTVYRPLPTSMEPVWSILSGREAVSPPLVYGHSPFAQPDVVKADTLNAGITYTVKLFVFKGYAVTEVGSTQFTYAH